MLADKSEFKANQHVCPRLRVFTWSVQLLSTHLPFHFFQLIKTHMPLVKAQLHGGKIINSFVQGCPVSFCAKQ